jgi:hypothetical protein
VASATTAVIDAGLIGIAHRSSSSVMIMIRICRHLRPYRGPSRR